MLRPLLHGLLPVLILALMAIAQPLAAQEGAADSDGEATEAPDPRAATGGAPTLEDILARQRGEAVPSRLRGAGDQPGLGLTQQLGVLGGTSDSELWEAMRYNAADITVSAGGDVAKVLMQNRGIWWYTFRDGPLKTYGGYLLLGTLVLLVLFYLIRGKVRIDGGPAGVTIERFRPLERFSHWLLAGSFILLALTGLITLFARVAIIPYLGPEVASEIATLSKWIHNNVSWAFILGLILVFFLWVLHNLPSRHDLIWFAKGGGILTKAHPPAKKFNAGQKLIFWAVILLGGSISASGLSLLFPFELPMFAPTFAKLNALGVPGLLGMETYPEVLAPHEEMQYAQLWHSIAGFVLMAIIIAHIYIGSVGMEGAYAAMGSGQVDLKWAKDHHSLWVEEVQAKEAAAPKGATPAE